MMPWDDFYTPRDFYGDASMQAKKFCKTHPDADKETVYYAAQEAARLYEASSELRTKKFWRIVYIFIKNALYKKKRKEQQMDAELKTAIIRDYESGMTTNEIAERYGLNPITTKNNIYNWSKKGGMLSSELQPNRKKRLQQRQLLQAFQKISLLKVYHRKPKMSSLLKEKRLKSRLQSRLIL